MKLEDALQDISSFRYYQLSGYKYRTLNQANHCDLTFDQLPDKMKTGIIKLINGLYQIQKMVYSYDLEFVRQCLKKAGINIKEFYKSCGLKDWFYFHHSLKTDAVNRLTAIRSGIIKIINRLFNYILY